MIAIIDYGAGNLQSVANALKKLGQEFKLVKEPSELTRAEKVILPGVGAAGAAMQKMLASGFIEELPRLKIPLLGICLGMQLLADFSEEGGVQCLGLIPGRVKKFTQLDVVLLMQNIICLASLRLGLKVPQIGWNKVDFTQKSPLTDGIPDGNYFYFVNSYYFDAPDKYVIATTDYGISFPSIIQKENFYATQFHPEKSGETGLKLLNNFCTKC